MLERDRDAGRKKVSCAGAKEEEEEEEEGEAQVLRRRSRGGECGQVLDGMFNIGNSWCKTGRI